MGEWVAMMNWAPFAHGEFVQDSQKRKLPRRGQRRFRLIEQVDSILEAILEQRQERLAV